MVPQPNYVFERTGIHQVPSAGVRRSAAQRERWRLYAFNVATLLRCCR